MRDDPFYLTEERSIVQSRTQDDVDSIPVVRLQDLPSLSQIPGSYARSAIYHRTVRSHAFVAEDPRLPTLKSLKPKPPQTFVIDRVGEMPEGASRPASLPPSSKSPAPSQNGAVASNPSFFPSYEGADAIPRTGTPPPIKVTRAKKKTKSLRTNGKTRTGAETPRAQ